MNKKNINRIVLVIAAILAIVIFRSLGLDQYLTLEYLKESQARFQELYLNHQIPVIGSYMGIYILVTALSLPGAAVMTLAGGGLFGFVTGAIVVSFASTIGATLACMVSRYLLQDWVQNRFADKLAAMNRGIEKEGAFYLFTLRLIPVFPFFVINLAMGMTRMPLTTFFWVSQIGMLPGTLVFVNAGKELAKIDSLSGVLSPALLGSFIILGLFPITVKKLLALYRRKFRPATGEGEFNG
ncbi:MAG: TVP38/TMEM64 family protein [Proteobacteria bacterium]|nr:TVP38/TMEM64 family protein [Pseudomonadota bacterium]MBU1736671.1 TVP38/TMEM64 family protein [Pseudomonadota bacterium]